MTNETQMWLTNDEVALIVEYRKLPLTEVITYTEIGRKTEYIRILPYKGY